MVLVEDWGRLKIPASPESARSPVLGATVEEEVRDAVMTVVSVHPIPIPNS
jgi:hypothetical protein